MDATMIDEHLENLDRRLTRVEQILPTLATKADLQSAITPLATKEELRAAIAPLETRDDIDELRRHMHVLSEDQRADTRLIAEHLAVVMSRLPER